MFSDTRFHFCGVTAISSGDCANFHALAKECDTVSALSLALLYGPILVFDVGGSHGAHFWPVLEISI